MDPRKSRIKMTFCGFAHSEVCEAHEPEQCAALRQSDTKVSRNDPVCIQSGNPGIPDPPISRSENPKDIGDHEHTHNDIEK